MKKMLLGLTAVFALSVSLPAFAAEEKTEKTEKTTKTKKGGKTKEKTETKEEKKAE